MAAAGQRMRITEGCSLATAEGCSLATGFSFACVCWRTDTRGDGRHHGSWTTTMLPASISRGHGKVRPKVPSEQTSGRHTAWRPTDTARQSPYRRQSPPGPAHSPLQLREAVVRRKTPRAMKHSLARSDWSTAALGGPADTSPMELDALGAHLSACRGQQGRFLAMRCLAERLHCHVSTRIVTSLVVAGGLLFAVSALLVWSGAM